MSFQDDVHREAMHDWCDERDFAEDDRPSRAELAMEARMVPGRREVDDAVMRAIRDRLALDADKIRRGLA